MADPTPTPETDEGARVDAGSASGMPRWVKVSLIIVAVLILTFLILKVAGIGGEHGPGRHMDGNDTSSSVTEHGPPHDIPNHGQ